MSAITAFVAVSIIDTVPELLASKEASASLELYAALS